MHADPFRGRRLPIGAEPLPDSGVHFRVWAPKRRRAAIQLEPRAASFPLQAEGDGYHAGVVSAARAGSLYRIVLDDAESLPDPASRFQPDGPHGPSMVVDPFGFSWRDDAWRGIAPESRVVYELHVGTFTPDGTWRAALAELPALRDLGVTLLQLMPVSDFPGRFGWGYDGVNLFAPSRLYGEPDDFRRFVDRAHALGLGVILDVVYNHLGPDGNHLRAFADEYFSTRYTTDWGEALNFDDEGAGAVREFVLANVRHWIEEYHLDGLRLDATQNIYDASARHILCDIAEQVRRSAPERETFVVAENEPQQANLVRAPEAGGLGLDAIWNDDWHHSAMVALTGRDEAYYADYCGRASEFVAAAVHGFLFQGQWYQWQKKRRGSPSLDLEPGQLVHFLQNHDQVANSVRGDRLHKLTSPSRLRAMTAVLLLGPQIPMLFQGQEFAASSPFLYFADHVRGLRELVRTGRASFLGQFQSIAAAQQVAALPDPGDPAAFLRSKLDHRERDAHGEVYALHRDLLALRHGDPVLGRTPRADVAGAVLRDDSFVLRFFGRDAADRLLLVNLGMPLHLDAAPEPLLAPPERCIWATRWSSEDSAYGGLGMPSLSPNMQGWCIPGGCAVLLTPALDASATGAARDE
jgi:maltooligosyltrehalose trehalohydrolase